jgi:hypothetical protein
MVAKQGESKEASRSLGTPTNKKQQQQQQQKWEIEIKNKIKQNKQTNIPAIHILQWIFCQCLYHPNSRGPSLNDAARLNKQQKQKTKAKTKAKTKKTKNGKQKLTKAKPKAK